MRMTDGDVAIRLFAKDDREDIVRLGDNARVARFLANRFPHPYRPADADAWLALVADETPPHNFAVEWRGKFIGGIGLAPLADVHFQTADLGYWLGEPYWGKGLAARALALLIAYAFSRLPYIRLQALVFEENTASMRVLEKNHFIKEGVLRRHVTKNGAVLNAALYALLREEAAPPFPSEFVATLRIVRSDEEKEAESRF